MQYESVLDNIVSYHIYSVIFDIILCYIILY